MKIVLLIGALVTGAIFFTGKPIDLAGTWVLDTTGNKCEAAILHIQMADGYYAARLDIPAQQVYDKPVSVEIKKDKIKIILEKNGTCFIEGTISGADLKGRSVVEGKAQAVRFYRIKK